ncbi:universal stress protein [Bradyrhizobium sp. UFLA05-109]
MPIKDVLLPLVGEPSKPALAAIETCVAAAADLGAKITAFAVEEDILVRPMVVVSSDLDNAAEVHALRTVTDVQDLLNAFRTAASRLNVRADGQLHKLEASAIASAIAERARYGDLTLVPVKANDSQSEHLIEQLIFESGRPLLLCPEAYADKLRVKFENVVIAWDHSARAARAVGDALPILQAAASVRIVTVTDEQAGDVMKSGAGLVDHLREHGVFASFETVRIDGSSIGKVLGSYANAHAIDAIIMGAYHHSRLNEIVWGGVTKTVIGEPPCWVMMSH